MQLHATPGAVAESDTEGRAMAQPGETEVLDELLVEEVSIDGMCGVY